MKFQKTQLPATTLPFKTSQLIAMQAAQESPAYEVRCFEWDNDGAKLGCVLLGESFANTDDIGRNLIGTFDLHGTESYIPKTLGSRMTLFFTRPILSLLPSSEGDYIDEQMTHVYQKSGLIGISHPLKQLAHYKGLFDMPEEKLREQSIPLSGVRDKAGNTLKVSGQQIMDAIRDSETGEKPDKRFIALEADCKFGIFDQISSIFLPMAMMFAIPYAVLWLLDPKQGMEVFFNIVLPVTGAVIALKLFSKAFPSTSAWRERLDLWDGHYTHSRDRNMAHNINKTLQAFTDGAIMLVALHHTHLPGIGAHLTKKYGFTEVAIPG